MATQGQKVSLGLEPRAGVAVSDALNDFEKLATGRLMLPNLIVGMPILVVVRLTVPPQSTPTDLLDIRFAWEPAGGEGRRVLHAVLGGLPAVPLAEWSELPVDLQVREQEALLMVARAQREASRAHERGDVVATANWIASARTGAMSLPTSFAVEDELRAIDEIEAALHGGDNPKLLKLLKFRAYKRNWNPTAQPPEEKPEPPPSDKGQP